MRRLSLILPSVLLLAACAPQGGTHRWQSPTITYYVNVGANEQSEAAIRTVFGEWEKATRLTFTYGGRNEAGIRRDGKSTVSFVRRWSLALPQEKVSYCRCWYDQKGNIVEADIIFHIQIVGFTTRSNRMPKTYCLEGALSHEIGHLIGLGDIDSPDSLMKPTSTPDESWNDGRIDAGTLAAYRALYGITK